MADSSSSSMPLKPAPVQLSDILAGEVSLLRFHASEAYRLGTAIHDRVTRLFPGTPVVINITHANSNQLLYHSATASGISPDNDEWIRRKRNTVLRWGCSSWYVGRKFGGDEETFAKKYMLGERGGDYAIHGGGVPLKVENVQGLVGVLVVSGLKQEDDHMVAVEALQQLAADQRLRADNNANDAV